MQHQWRILGNCVALSPALASHDAVHVDVSRNRCFRVARRNFRTLLEHKSKRNPHVPREEPPLLLCMVHAYTSRFIFGVWGDSLNPSAKKPKPNTPFLVLHRYTAIAKTVVLSLQRFEVSRMFQGRVGRARGTCVCFSVMPHFFTMFPLAPELVSSRMCFGMGNYLPPPRVQPPPPPCPTPPRVHPPPGGGTVIWPMNNKKSIGNHRCRRR